MNTTLRPSEKKVLEILLQGPAAMEHFTAYAHLKSPDVVNSVSALRDCGYEIKKVRGIYVLIDDTPIETAWKQHYGLDKLENIES